MEQNSFGEKLRQLRISQGMTLEQVAVKVGVGKSTVRKWEIGMIENMRRDKIVALAAALGTTPEYLMGWGDGKQRVALTPYQQSEIVDLFKTIMNEKNITEGFVTVRTGIDRTFFAKLLRPSICLVDKEDFYKVVNYLDVYSDVEDILSDNEGALVGKKPLADNGERLTESEQIMINAFRHLSPDRRDALLRLVLDLPRDE